MKKIIFIFALSMFASIIATAQTQLTWRIANAEVINAGAQLQFDVEVKADAAGTFHRDLQVYFDYSPAGFGSDIVTNGDVMVTPLGLMNTHYVVVNTADNTSSKVAVITEATNEMSQVGSTTYFHEMPVTFTGLLRFTIDIADNSVAAGIVFDQALMNGGQYYQSVSNFDPVKYDDPSAFGDNLSTFVLSSAYGNLTYNNAGSTALDDFTVMLMQGGIEQASGLSDASGNFNISNIADGIYDLEYSWTIPRGGTNILDAINTRQYLGGSYPMTALQQKAANVNENAVVDILDAIFLQQSLSGPQPGGWTAPDFVFLAQTLTIVNGIGTATEQGLCSGDPNGSHIP